MENHNKKQLIAAGISFVVFVLIMILIYFLFFNKEEKPVENKIETNKISNNIKQPETKKTGSGVYKKPEKLEVDEITQVDVEKFVSDFVERFGSYSNQANFDNIVVLKPLMTDSMRAWADKYVLDQRAKNKENKVYYGILTKSVAVEVVDFSDEGGSATFIVDTRRKSSFISKEHSSENFGQKIDVKTKKIGDKWVVDEAFWRDR